MSSWFVQQYVCLKEFWLTSVIIFCTWVRVLEILLIDICVRIYTEMRVLGRVFIDISVYILYRSSFVWKRSIVQSPSFCFFWSGSFSILKRLLVWIGGCPFVCLGTTCCVSRGKANSSPPGTLDTCKSHQKSCNMPMHCHDSCPGDPGKHSGHTKGF